MISYNNLLPFGQYENNILKIENSFSVSYTSDTTTTCINLNSLAFYTGEQAPKIRFALTVCGQNTPFYESHDYRIGKTEEYTRQAWRVPPMFLPKITLTVNISIP